MHENSITFHLSRKKSARYVWAEAIAGLNTVTTMAWIKQTFQRDSSACCTSLKPIYIHTHTQSWCVYYESSFSGLGLSACLVKEIMRHALCLVRYYYRVSVQQHDNTTQNAFCCYCHKTYAACRTESEGQISQVCNDDDVELQFQLNHDLLRRRVVQWTVIHNILPISDIYCRNQRI